MSFKKLADRAAEDLLGTADPLPEADTEAKFWSYMLGPENINIRYGSDVSGSAFGEGDRGIGDSAWNLQVLFFNLILIIFIFFRRLARAAFPCSAISRRTSRASPLRCSMWGAFSPPSSFTWRISTSTALAICTTGPPRHGN